MDKPQAIPKGADDCAVRIAVRQRPLSDSEKILLLATNNEENAEDFIQRAGDMAHNVYMLRLMYKIVINRMVCVCFLCR